MESVEKEEESTCELFLVKERESVCVMMGEVEDMHRVERRE